LIISVTEIEICLFKQIGDFQWDGIPILPPARLRTRRSRNNDVIYNLTYPEINHALWRRDDGITVDSNMSDELCVVFWSRSIATLANTNAEYVYDKSAGRGVTVYVIDSGASLRLPVYSQVSH